MKRYAVSLLCLLALLLPKTARAADRTVVNLQAYGVPIHYSDSATKSDGFLAGVYAYIGQGMHSFEVEADHTRINYKGAPDLEQWDYTGVYSYYRSRWKYRAGIHYIDSTDDWSNRGITLFAGARYFAYNNWDMGIDGYFTRYSNQTPHLSVSQVTPNIGWYLMKWKVSGIYLQLFGNYIHLNKDTELGLTDRNYYSGEGDLTYYYNRFSIKGYGWTGKQVFAVRNDGFVVYNLAEKHDGGFGGSISYDFANGLKVSLRSAVERYKEIGATRHSTMVTYMILLGRSF